MPDPIARLVIGNALDDSSDPALAAGMAVAKHGGARVTVVHAYALPILFFSQTTGTTSLNPRLIEAERSAKTTVVRGLLEVYQDATEVEPRLVVDMGAPHRLLLSTATEEQASLIVLGAHSRGPVSTMLGSTSDRVVRGATCPVLIVRGPFPLPPRRILAPVDLSALSEDALFRGIELIAPMLDRNDPPKIELLFVLSETERFRGQQFTPEQIDRLANNEIERVADRIHQRTGFAIHHTVRVGLPRHEILSALEEQPADLVVLGTHGHGGFERLVLGSVAVSVVHEAPGNVLVIPAREAVPRATTEPLAAFDNVISALS